MAVGAATARFPCATRSYSESRILDATPTRRRIAFSCPTRLLLFPQLHDPFTDALPFAIALHPGIHPNVGAGKLFTILVLALLRRRAGDRGQVRPIDMNIHVVVGRRAQGVGFVFSLIKQLGLGNMFSFGIKSGKVVRYHVSDGGLILVYQRLNPGVFHLLEIGLDCAGVSSVSLSVRAGRDREGEECAYQKWRE